MGEYENLKRQEKQNKRMTYLLRMRGSAPVGLSAAGVDGVIAEGNTITVNSDGTNNYGGGTVNSVFEMDGRNDADGELVTVNDPTIGSLQNTASIGTLTWTNAQSHSNGICVKLIDGTTELPIRCSQFTNDKTLLVSFFLFTPSGSSWPGETTADSYPASGSHAKLAWAMKDNGFGNDGLPDVHMFSTASGVVSLIDTNEPNMFTGSGYNLPNMNTLHTFGKWNWFACLIDGGSNYQIAFYNHNDDDGSIGNKKSHVDEDTFFGPDITAGNRFFNEVHYASFITSTSNTNMFYDDFICQTGAGAGCLVVIGDASTLTACTDLSVLRTTSATNTAITAIVRNGPFTSLSGKYIFAFDNNLSPVNYSGSQGRLIS